MNKNLDLIAKILLVIGGLNWGLIGAFNFDLVNLIFSFSGLVERIVYILVGLSALYALTWFKK